VPTSNPRFIVDEMVGRLARWLRIAGFDVWYRPSISNGELIGRALSEARIILTRDRALSTARTLPLHLLIRSPFLNEQLRQVFRELALEFDPKLIFSRCSECNRILEAAAKQSVKLRVPSYVYRHRQRFFYCPSCGKIFWKGSHYRKVVEKLRSVTEDRGRETGDGFRE
jgi:uncharacterized protein with PIN domain